MTPAAEDVERQAIVESGCDEIEQARIALRTAEEEKTRRRQEAQLKIAPALLACDFRTVFELSAAAMANDARPAPQTAVATAWKPIDLSFVSTAPAPRRWLLRHPTRDGGACAPGMGDGLLPLGKAGALSGEGGVSKTNVAIELAIAIPTGRRWLGHFDVDHGARSGRVLLGLAEEDVEEVHRRIYNVSSAFRLDDVERRRVVDQVVALPLAGLPVALMRFADHHSIVESPELSALRARLVDDAGPNGWSLVVLDPLARWAGPDVEGDNAAATRFVQAVETLTNVPGKPTVLVLHHSSKLARRAGSVDARGVTAITDGLRWAATLRADGADVYFEQIKSNYSIPMLEELRLVRGHGGLLRVPTENEERDRAEREEERERAKGAAADAKYAARLSEHIEKVVAVAGTEPRSIRELSAASQLRRDDASAAVLAAVGSGRLVRGPALRGHDRYLLPVMS